MALPWHMPVETLPTIRKIRDDKFQPSLLKHFCNVGFYDPPLNDVQTGIMCDIGPFNQSANSIFRLLGAGMTVARLVLEDLSHPARTNIVKSIRQSVYNYSIEMEQVYPLALLIDLRGPDILTGELNSGDTVEIIPNTVLRLTTDTNWQDNGTGDCLYFGYNQLASLKRNDIIYIDSLTKDKIKLVVLVVGHTAVDCNVVVGGLIGPHMIVRVVHVPKAHYEHKRHSVFRTAGDDDDVQSRIDSTTSLESAVDEELESHDPEKMISWAIASHIDGFILSNTKTVHCIVEVRRLAGRNGKNLLIFVCIDSFLAFDQFDKLLTEADGVYLDRNILGRCVPIENITIVTKIIMSKCNRAGKPCIVAAALNEKFTALCASDIANLVHDGVDVIALNFYYDTIDPKFRNCLDSVKVAETCMAGVIATCKYAEKTIWKPPISAFSKSILHSIDDTTKSVCVSAIELALRSHAVAIICLTNSGKAPKLLSQVKSLCPIVAVTRSCSTTRQLQLWRGIIVLHYFENVKRSALQEIDARILAALNLCKDRRIIQAGDPYVVVLWSRVGLGQSNTVRLLYASSRATVSQS